MRFRSLGVLFLSASLSAQTVYVVDDDGGPGVFTDLQAVLGFAPAGSVILMRDGNYVYTSTIDMTQPVSIVADTGANVQITGQLRLVGIHAESVLLHGLHVTGLLGPGLTIQSCSAPIHVEDSTFVAGTAFVLGTSAGASVGGSHSVAFERCTLLGGTSGSTTSYAGLDVVGATVAVHDSTLQGSSVVPTGFGAPPSGGAGLRLFLGFVHAQGCTLTGGSGADGTVDDFTCTDASDGGPGLELGDFAGGSADFVGRDNSIQGGPGGLAAGACAAGNPGPAVDAGSGSVTTVPGQKYSLSVPGPVRGLETASLTITGPVGDTVFLAVAFGPQPFYFAPFQSTLLLDLTLTSIPLGVIPPSGVVTANVVMPQLPVGVDVSTTYLQVIGITPGGQGTLGSGQALTLLGAGF